MKLGYYFKECDQELEDWESNTRIDLVNGINHVSDYLDANISYLFEVAYGNDDLWEFNGDIPVATIVMDGKEVGEFEIEVRYEPDFYPRRIKQ